MKNHSLDLDLEELKRNLRNILSLKMNFFMDRSLEEIVNKM